ncbi:hypothetical protein ACQ4PT_008753 [Festuca glaucescens]
MPPDAGPSVVIELVDAGYATSVPAGDEQIERHPSRHAVIPKVRAQLRRVADDLFTPHTVPIGPYHHDAGSWLLTQEKKWAVDDLERRGVDMSALKQMLHRLQSSARGYYTHMHGDHAMDSDEFCSMLLHDGCYLLGFFVDYDESQQPTGIGSPSSNDRQNIGSSDNTVVRDILYLLENQIPLFVILEIFECSRAQGEETPALKCIAGPVEEVLQKQLYISKKCRTPSSPTHHLLDLVYSYLTSRQEEEEPTSTVREDTPTGWCCWRRATEYHRRYAHLVYSYLAPQQQQQEPTSTVQEDPPTGRWRRATEYRRYADLLFKPRAFDAGDEWTILAVRLHGRTLSIPHLRIDSHTWTLLRNLMALEEHMEARPVTAYCYFLSQVACTAEDVELLRSAKVIEHFLGSDKSAAQGFAGLCNGVALDIDRLERNYLKPMWHGMEKRCGVRAHNFKGFFREKYCSNVFYPVVFFIAFIVFGCQVVQSIYAVIAYHKPNSSH